MGEYEKIHIVARSAAFYPKLLEQIAQPPEQLFCRGDLSLLHSSRLVAIVGSRKATRYGLQVVKDAVPELVQVGFVTVSGLALGIDAAVHRETLAADGRTIAVLGSSIENQFITPRTNFVLAQQILKKGGLIIGEYPCGVNVRAHHFLARNRIIAGLSLATVIVEAAVKSGALITAKHAVDANREVLAVPGSIYAPLSVGCNNLIAHGATPWLSCESLYNALEFLQIEVQKNEDVVASSPNLQRQLSDLERQILLCLSSQSLSLEDILQQFPLNAPEEIITGIGHLELLGIIMELSPQHYQLKQLHEYK